MARFERSARQVLSDWHFWMGVSYFGLATVIVALFVLFNRTAHEEAVRAASARAAATTQVGQCFTAAKNAPVAEGFIDSHEAIIENSLIVNRASIEAAPADPLNAVRRKAIVRLEKAEKNVVDLRALIRDSTPTTAKCRTLARTLHVDASRYIHPAK